MSACVLQQDACVVSQPEVWVSLFKKGRGHFQRKPLITFCLYSLCPPFIRVYDLPLSKTGGKEGKNCFKLEARRMSMFPSLYMTAKVFDGAESNVCESLGWIYI